MIPQIFVPIASQFSRPENKGRNVGIVISGLLTGILASRVVSGFVGEVLGWREMYFIAAGMMLLCAIAVLKILPDIQPTFRGKYGDLMKSLFSLIKDYPSLRIYSIRAGIAFGSFLAMWSCLAFKMGQAPFYADSDVIGILGLCGIAGASTASLVGKYVKKVGIRNFNFIGCGLILLAWASLYFCGNTYAGIIAGVLLIDIGMQCIQLSNQTNIFDICPSASNRVNTIFMTTYFTGGSLGTFLAGSCWQTWGWAGVAGIGTVLTLLQSYAAGQSPAGVLRWYMAAAGFAGAGAAAFVLGVPLRMAGKALQRWVLRPAAQRRVRQQNARKLRRNAKRTAKKRKKNLPNRRRMMYNS